MQLSVEGMKGRRLAGTMRRPFHELRITNHGSRITHPDPEKGAWSETIAGTMTGGRG